MSGLVAAIVGAAAAVYGGYNSYQNFEENKKTGREQKKNMERSRERMIAGDTAEAARTAQAAMLLSKRKAAAISGGKSSTLLTSPLGIPGGSNLTPKTALGA